MLGNGDPVFAAAAHERCEGDASDAGAVAVPSVRRAGAPLESSLLVALELGRDAVRLGVALKFTE